MKKFKKVFALTLMSVMLCGNALTAFAAENTSSVNQSENRNDSESDKLDNDDNSDDPSSDGNVVNDSDKDTDSGSGGNSGTGSGSGGNSGTGSGSGGNSGTGSGSDSNSGNGSGSDSNSGTGSGSDSNSNTGSGSGDNSGNGSGNSGNTGDNTGNNSNTGNDSGNSGSSSNNSSNPGVQYASDEWKDHIRAQLNRHYTDLKVRYELSDDQIRRMDRIYNSAMNYMKSAGLTLDELRSYESEVEGYLNKIAEEEKETFPGTEKFLMLSNEAPILSAQYGEQTFVVLSLINLGKADITDIVVTPTVSNDKTKWPFDINQAYDAKTIQLIQAADDVTDAANKRMDIGWYFNVRSDVLTGCYPLPFHVTYYENGALAETDITTYINIKGSDPKKTLIKDPDAEEDEKKQTNPRIIVTGYRTEPEVVYAGSTFNLTVSVKNTSRETAVENVLFNMEATVEGKEADATYSAFLPTSGSSSVYTERIAPGETYDMSIEMEAKSDLSQKPYVLTVNMKYDTEDQINLSDSAHVSVPIKQEAKIDTGSAEIMPESIAVGEQSNVMFSVFNTGKTTLYNVKVTYEGGTVESGITYLGNIAPGATQNVDSMLTGIAPDMGEGIVKAVITYEDEAGNETRFEKDLNLYVYEMTFDDGMMEEYPMEPMEPEQDNQKLPLAAVIGIAAAVIIVIAVIVVIVSKKRKAKKHKEDMDLLDGDDV